MRAMTKGTVTMRKSNRRGKGLLGRLGALAAFVLGASMLLAGPASAATVELHKYNGVYPAGSFDGTGSNGAPAPFPSGLNDMSIFQETGQVFVGNSSADRIYKFDAAGAPQPFANLAPATAISQTLNNFGDVIVDNSAAATKGRIYGFPESGPVRAYDPSGSPAANFPISVGGACGGDVAPDGSLWIASYNQAQAIQFNSTTGAATGQSFSTPSPCDLAIDSQGNFYAVRESSAIVRKYDSSGVLQGIFANESGSGEPEVAVDLSNDDVYVDYRTYIAHYTKTGTLISKFGQAEGGYPGLQSSRGIAVRASNHVVYAMNEKNGTPRVDTFVPTGPIVIPDATTNPAISVTRNSAVLNGVLNPDSVATTDCKFEWGTTTAYSGGSVACAEGNVFTGSSNVPVTAPLGGLTSSTVYHFRLSVMNANGTAHGLDQTFTTEGAVKSLQTLSASSVGLDSATLNGSFDRDGSPTNFYFEYGTTTSYGATTAVPPGPLAGSDSVSASVSGLDHGATYHFRLVATNSFGTTVGLDESFYTSSAPSVSDDLFVSDVNTDAALVHLTTKPNGEATTYHIEYGTEGDCAVSACESTEERALGEGIADLDSTFQLIGLESGVTYHYRVVAHNTKGDGTNSVDHHFATFARPVFESDCPNLLARQQTGAALLLDCRAYELVSAANAGGYDVESNLIPGQAPLTAYPRAQGRLLYSLHAGVIPGVAGNPTNNGVDPYVATRGLDGWSTAYVGIPADAPSAAPFASTLLAADSALDTFAFGGPDICSPCFGNGAVGVPIHMPDGSLQQGMAGQSDPGAAAEADGLIARPLSADGSHLVFGSLLEYQPDGNDNTGDVSIYDRNLKTGITQVVSKTPAGANLPCLQGAGACHSPGDTAGISELDISEQGDRIVVGQLVSTDAAGNHYYHLYMHLGTDPHTIDLTPGAADGVLFDGMTSDGAKVFYTTKDQLISPDDGDSSADIYEADVDSGGALTLRLVSTLGNGEPSNDDSCTPPGDPDSWNGVAGNGHCDAVAVAGGGGVASGDGTLFFFSPEVLDTSDPQHQPVQDQANFYVSTPSAAPQFVATVDSSIGKPGPPPLPAPYVPIDNPAVVHGVHQAGIHSYGDFQVTPSGRYAVFSTAQQPTDQATKGHFQIYRYDAQADQLECASCSPTEAAATGDASLTPQGLNLSDDGRVFFTSPDQLALRDTDGKLDAYEWNGTDTQLISTGASESDSGMVTVSADGVDAFFFTRQALVPSDLNGNAMKIYDARAEGGFPANPPRPPCAASDECHGPGTVAAPPPPINTVTGSGAQSGSRNKRKHHHRKKHRHRKHRHTTRRHG
jgi:Fibronectin type III domain